MTSDIPDTKQFATFSSDEILAHFKSSLHEGLSSGEVSQRLEKEGYNEISANRVQWWEILLRQFK